MILEDRAARVTNGTHVTLYRDNEVVAEWTYATSNAARAVMHAWLLEDATPLRDAEVILDRLADERRAA